MIFIPRCAPFQGSNSHKIYIPISRGWTRVENTLHTKHIPTPRVLSTRNTLDLRGFENLWGLFCATTYGVGKISWLYYVGYQGVTSPRSENIYHILWLCYQCLTTLRGAKSRKILVVDPFQGSHIGRGYHPHAPPRPRRGRTYTTYLLQPRSRSKAKNQSPYPLLQGGMVKRMP